MKAFRKNRRPGNRAMTVAQRAHVDRVKSIGCVCCDMMGYPHEDGAPLAEADHQLSGGIRIGHDDVIPLCEWHHRARLIVNGWNHKQHRIHLGPSKAEGTKPFYACFGSKERLEAHRDQMLARAAA